MSVALITGGLGAIGRELTARYLAAGVAVEIVDVAPDTEERAAALGARGHRVDITDERQVAALRELEGIDRVVNNAGIWPLVAFEQMTSEQWRTILDVSLTGAFLVTQALVPSLRATRGSVVNVSSAIALKGAPSMTAYAAAKAGLLGLTKSLARELGPDGIRVNAVAPGLVDTEHNRALWGDDVRERIARERCLPGTIAPGDVADAIAYLSSPAAGQVTGQTLVVDGGVVLQ